MTLVRQAISKAQWRLLLGILLMGVLGAGCDSGSDGSQPQAAEWHPDSLDFALTYDAACDEPCEHFDGSYTSIAGINRRRRKGSIPLGNRRMRLAGSSRRSSRN